MYTAATACSIRGLKFLLTNSSRFRVVAQWGPPARRKALISGNLHLRWSQCDAGPGRIDAGTAQSPGYFWDAAVGSGHERANGRGQRSSGKGLRPSKGLRRQVDDQDTGHRAAWRQHRQRGRFAADGCWKKSLASIKHVLAGDDGL